MLELKEMGVRARQAARTLERTWPETFVAQPVGKLSDQKDLEIFSESV